MTNVVTDQRLSESELCPDELLAAQEAAFARDMDRLRARRVEFVSVACPACKCAEAALAFEKETFEWMRCRRCSTVYMSPRPSRAVMEAYYSGSENYRFWATHIFPASEHARREKVCMPRLARIVEIMRRHDVKCGSLLEIGPGFGTFAALAQASGTFERVMAIEPTPEMAAACRARGVAVLEERIENAALPVAVDVLVAFEVIEHLFEPRDMVQRCMDLLAPGGLLVLTCPSNDGFDIQYLGAASLSVDAEHVNLFNPHGLHTLLESSGFETIERMTPGRLDVEFVHRAIADGTVQPPSDPFMRRVLMDEYETLGWPFQQFLATNGLSSHMWFVARKPGVNDRERTQEGTTT